MKLFEVGNNEIQSMKRTRVLLKIDLKMIAEAKGVSKKTVQRAIKSGTLNITNLKSISEFIVG